MDELGANYRVSLPKSRAERIQEKVPLWQFLVDSEILGQEGLVWIERKGKPGQQIGRLIDV